MRKLKTTDISNSVGFPPKGGTFVHLQQAYLDGFNWLAQYFRANEYSASVVYIISGLKYSTAGGNYTITDGLIYYNGELFEVNSLTAATTTAATFKAIVTTNFTDATADPVQFTDGNDYNVHEIRKVSLTAEATTGTGLADFPNAVRLLAPNVKNSQTATALSGSYIVDLTGHSYTLSTSNTSASTVLGTSGMTSQMAYGAKATIVATFTTSATLTFNGGGYVKYQAATLVGDLFDPLVGVNVSSKRVLISVTHTILGYEVELYQV